MSSAPGSESAASKLANTAGEAAANIPRTGVSGKGWLAIIGAGALIVSGSVFAYNSLHKEEEAFTADGGEEFAQVCQDAKTGRRVEDSECEKAGEAANSSDSSSSSTSNNSSHNNSGSNSNSGTHNNQSHVTNAFLWYYIGSQAGRNGSIPAVGSSLAVYLLRAAGLSRLTAAPRRPARSLAVRSRPPLAAVRAAAQSLGRTPVRVWAVISRAVIPAAPSQEAIPGPNQVALKAALAEDPNRAEAPPAARTRPLSKLTIIPS